MILGLTAIIENHQRNELLCQPYAAIDTEYRKNDDEKNNSQKPYTIFAVAIVDSLGDTKLKHESDFSNNSQPEKELVKWAMSEILRYKLTIGWYSKGVRIKKEGGAYAGKDSDLKILDDACRFHNIPSIIAFDKRGVPYVKGYDQNLCNANPDYANLNKFDWYYHIDLYNIYKKQMLKSIYQNKYRNLGLDSVSKAILKEGKLEDLDGQQIQELPKEKLLQYVCQDAVLVMKLSKHNNYEVFDLMNAISTITNVPFDRVCHTGVSSWWTKILNDKIENYDCRLPTLNAEERKKKKKYKGGHVIDPKAGYYYGDNHTVYVLDVKSLYPTMMINNNISFDTVNCPCCKDNPYARVQKEINDLIKEEDEKATNKRYWICKDLKYRGIIPRLLEQYRNERFRQQELGNNAMQIALKNLINGCYGLFGSEFFEFADYRVAELTTAFGRLTLAHMKHIAEEVYGFEVVYGDTDSIFVTNVKNERYINKFLAECSIVLEDVEIDLSKTYRKTLILKKKHYIGIPFDTTKAPDIKGIEGIKSDRPIWINNLQKELVEDITNNRNPTIKLKHAYMDMEKGQVPPELLSISTTLKKDPSSYSLNAYQRIVGSQTNAKEGDSIKYYKSNTKGTTHSNPSFINIGKYLEMMQSTFEEQLKVLGYDFLKDVVGVKSLADF
jgi:DNA polymerase, archaea type